MRALGRKSGSDNAGETKLPEAEGSAEALELSDIWVDEDSGDEAHDVPRRSLLAKSAPLLAVLAVTGWSGFFVWAHLADMQASPVPAQWAQWVVMWAVPVELVGIVWLLAMRSSQAEAQRFAATAAAMNRESAALEARLKVVNRELSLAREFLAAEARDLDALGRIAAERLSSHASELQALIRGNGAEVETIATTSETALGNMNRLRDDLPVIANAARDVTNQIGSAGRVAEEQLSRLAGGFERITTVGTESEELVARLGENVGSTLAGFESQLVRIDALVSQRFAALRTEAEGYRAAVGALEEEAMAALRERAGTAASEAESTAARLRDAAEEAEARFAGTIKGLHD
ncbi:MAG: ATPase, partial [Erythrobacter sp.]|nr:ATPase [Erythrobacter sp.]